MSKVLKPCPFCKATMRIQSNRDWHRLVGEHDEKCVFTDSETMMVPATDEQLALVIEDWNRRAQPAEAEGVEVVAHFVIPLAGWAKDRQFAERGPVPEKLNLELYRAEPLMTVAQHQRILSAVTAERDRLENELEETELRALRFFHRFSAATDLGRELREALELIEKSADGEQCRQIAYDALEPFRARAAIAAKEG